MQTTIAQVLAQGGAPASHFSLVFYCTAGAAVVLISALSVYKGYGFFRRGRWLSTMIDDKPPLAEVNQQEEIEKLNFILDKLSQENRQLAEQNSRLVSDINRINESWQMAKKDIETMERSTQLLVKANEKLATEKEQLLLAASIPLIKLKKKAAKKAPKEKGNKQPSRVLSRRKK